MATSITISKQIAIKDEGVVKTSDANSINFTGAGVTATNVGNAVTVNIPGGGGGITSVTGTSPIVSSGGTTPAISMGVASGLSNGYLANSDWTSFNNKQSPLISGVSIKTINSNTILGAGDLLVQPTLVSGTNIKTINGNSILGSGNIIAGGSKIIQVPTFDNQYQAGSVNTLMFSANIISTLGQQIDLDFIAKNNLGGTSLLRVYINSSATLTGATLFGSITLPPVVNESVRYYHRLSVTRTASFNYYLYGMDTYINNDFDTQTVTYDQVAFIGFNAFTKPFIIVALNQQSTLSNASISY